MTHPARSTIVVATGDIHPVRIDLYLPPRPAGTCVLCPGFKGYKSWGFFPFLAGQLCKAGFAAVVIDFSHNGTICLETGDSGNGRDLYCAPDLFSKNTISRECDDLASLLSHITTDGLGGAIDPILPIALLGHSRAGVAVILNAFECLQVKAISSWGMPAHPDIFSEEQKKRWLETGALEFTDSATETLLRIDSTYLRDIEYNYSRFDMADAVTRLTTPYLIVNGITDLPAPPTDAVRLFRASNRANSVRLLLVRSGHTFGAASSATAPTTALRRSVEETVNWFRTHLDKGDR